MRGGNFSCLESPPHRENKKRITRGRIGGNPRESAAKKSPKNRMRPKASHPRPHRSCAPARLGHRRGGVITASSPKALDDRVPTFAEAGCRFAVRGRPTLQPCSSPQFLPAPESGHGERPQRRAPAALARISGSSPGDRLSPITGWLRALPQSSSDQEPSRFAAHTLLHFAAARNTKTSLRLCRSCGRPVFFVESVGKVRKKSLDPQPCVERVS